MEPTTPRPLRSKVSKVEIVITNDDGSTATASRDDHNLWTLNGPMWPRFLRMLDEIQESIRHAESPS